MTDFYIHQLVPISIFDGYIEVKDKWLEYAKTADYQRMKSNTASYTKNWHILNKMPDLKKQIKSKFEIYARQYFKIKNNINFDFTTSWLNEFRMGDSASPHSHVNSMFSGVYYLNANQDMGSISFHIPPYYNPVTTGFQLEFDEYTQYNCCEHTLHPRPGAIIIFPSYLLHSVGENKLNENRYSLAFNLMFKNSQWGEREQEIKI